MINEWYPMFAVGLILGALGTQGMGILGTISILLVLTPIWLIIEIGFKHGEPTK